MNIQTILENSLAGELQNTNLQGLNKDGVSPEKLKQYIHILNAGLTDLHTRFFLKKEAVTLKLKSGVRAYTLSLQNAVSQGNPNAPIQDSEQLPFKDNVLEVLEAYRNGSRVGIGVAGGVYITTPQSIYVDGSIQDAEVLELVYKANHVSIPSTAPTTTEVVLPPSHLQALYYYIGARIMTPQTTGLAMIEGRAFHEGSYYMKQYEDECTRLALNGIDADSMDVVSLFHQRGFI